MYDLIVNFIGAVAFSVMGYFYVKHRNTKSLVEGLVPEPWAEEKYLEEKTLQGENFQKNDFQDKNIHEKYCKSC